MSRASLDDALKFTLRWEGGYVNDPRDPGGETYAGISRRAHPDIWARADAEGRKVLTRSEIREAYLEDYWGPCHCAELPPATAIAVFDYAVHSGGLRSRRILQTIAGARADGRIGLRTMRQIEKNDDRVLAFGVLAERRAFLDRLSRSGARMNYARRGWFRRLDALKSYLTEV